MPGLKFLHIPEFVDQRGRLRVCEIGGALPFTPVRTFLLSDLPSDRSRAGHAVSSDLFLLMVSGECTLTTATDEGEQSYRLTIKSGGVHIPAQTWILLKEFALGTIILVHAEKLYGEVSYSDRIKYDS